MFQIFIYHMLRVNTDCLVLNLFVCFFWCLSVILGSVRGLRVSNKSLRCLTMHDGYPCLRRGGLIWNISRLRTDTLCYDGQLVILLSLRVPFFRPFYQLNAENSFATNLGWIYFQQGSVIILRYPIINNFELLLNFRASQLCSFIFWFYMQFYCSNRSISLQCFGHIGTREFIIWCALSFTFLQTENTIRKS